jgi:elongation factor G
MKEARSESIRNIALISYTGAGKTSLLEAMLYTAGAIPAMGSVPAGTTIADYEPEEIHRKVSINLSVAHFQWKETLFNIVDTPGALSFQGEAKAALNAVDGLLIVMGASSGMRTELERLWPSIQDLGLPCILFVNELDKERTELAPILEEFEKSLEAKTVPVAIPIGSGPQIEGVRVSSTSSAGQRFVPPRTVPRSSKCPFRRS